MAKDTTGRLHVTVKSGGKRKLSSKLWLERQLNDPYVAQAKRDGYRSRAAYKLIEIDDKYRFLKHGIAVVDLGAAPGGWSQIAAKRVGAVNGKGKVVAIDLLEMPEVPGVNFAQLDFLADDAPEKLIAMMGGRADVVMSDMAPNTTGRCRTGHPIEARFCQRAPRQAGVQPPGFIRALRAGDGISGWGEGVADSRRLINRWPPTVRHRSIGRGDLSETYLGLLMRPHSNSRVVRFIVAAGVFRWRMARPR
jgi:23S rRNA U2552 (ribose-2'-O)-methylase RlmE/FtsJ